MTLTPADITLVTVTYGDRASLLLRSLMSAYKEGIRSMVIVNNGVSYDLEGLLRGKFEDCTFRVVSMGKNSGSAKGYSEGMKAALAEERKFIFLLDDDGELQTGCIETLLKNYSELVTDPTAEANTILSAIRLEHISDIREGVLTRSINRRSAFRRLHIVDIPYRFLRRIGALNRLLFSTDAPYRFKVTYSVYSGLLFHRGVIKRHGLPRTEFLLYGDDLEFTYRITANGGNIWLITNALIRDMDISWWCRLKAGNPFEALITGGSDSVVYYAFRNEVYFEAYCLKRSGPLYNLHRSIYMTLLYLTALRRGRLKRFKILKQALKDGVEGRLGENKDFPL